MQINMRKILAVLSCVAMLCTVLPFGALMPVSAATVKSYDFEDGTTSWGSSTTVIEDNGGHAIRYDAAKYGYINKVVTLTANTWYKVTFDHKGDAVNSLLWDDDADKAVAIKQPAASADWTTQSYVFYSGEYTSLNFRFQNPSSSAKTIYLDNIKLETYDGTVAYDGYLYDGNMEANQGSWVDMNGSSTIVSDPTGAGQGNVMQTNATAAGNMFKQRFYMDAQTDYVLSFKVYCYASSSDLTDSVFFIKFSDKVTYDLNAIEHDGLRDVAKNNDYTVRCNVYSNTGKWINVSIPFSCNADTATATDITVYNYRSIGKYYFDDFKVVEAGEEPSEPSGPVNGEASDDGYIINGNFESTDLSKWKVGMGVVSGDLAHGGNNSLYSDTNATQYGYTASYYVDVEKNTNYTVTFWFSYATTYSKDMRLYIHDGANDGKELIMAANNNIQPIVKCDDSSAVAGVWKQVSLSFNSGENETLLLKFGGGSGGYSAVYLDDIVMTKDAVQPEPDEPEVPELPPVATEPSNDGYIVNGTFETGALDPWTVDKGGKVSYVDGSYVLEGTAPDKYDNHVKQTVSVEANTDYLITFKAKLAASGGQIRFVVNGNGTRLNNDAYYFTESTTEWQTFQIQFNSGANTAVDLCPNQGVTGGGNIYYDDITMKKVVSVLEKTEGSDIRVMSYNVLVDTDEENGGWSWGQPLGERGNKGSALIAKYLPDVIGFQECTYNWHMSLKSNLPNYAFVNADVPTSMPLEKTESLGKADWMCTTMMYNTDTLTLISNELIGYSVNYWGSIQRMRYISMALFEVKATGERFVFTSTHFDAEQDEKGEEMRLTQAGELAARLNYYRETYNCPIVSTGDFNSEYSDAPLTLVRESVGMDTSADNRTYIDYILFTEDVDSKYFVKVGDDGASDHDPIIADLEFLDEYTTPIKNAKDYIKTQGRNTLKDGALWLDFSASGIEFSANCEGKVALNLNVKSIKNTDATYGGIYFTVIVDGVKVDRAQCRITSTGNVELVLAENLTPGNHTFEVYRQTEHRGAEVGISSIVMNGSFNEKPEDNRLFIEFIGDSISTGYGALGAYGDAQPDSPKWQDATVAYPFLTAKALGADFSDVCYSGIGAKYGWQDPNMLNFYPYQRWQYDHTTQYNFNARQPDVVVIALGTNDIAMESERGITLEQRLAGYQELLDLVRAKNPNSKIVWIYGMMKDEDNARIPAIIEENGGAAAGLYSLELVTNTAGAGYHPSAAGQQKFADDLVAFLNSDVLVKYVGDEMLDNDEGDVIDYIGSSRMEMTASELGLAFGFGLNIEGLAITNGCYADLTNATIDAFGDGTQYKLLRMGAIVSNNPVVGLSDMKLADVDGKKTIDVNAAKLYDLEGTYAQFAVRITNIPAENEATVIYARAYFVIEYEGREVVFYDDTQAANYINKYEQNDGVLEW